jgi:CRISP-associated protein Cas1
MDKVYVLEPGAYIRREGISLKIIKGADVIDHIPAEGLKSLMVVGYVSLSGGVLDFLIQNRVETVFITPTGRFKARLALDEHKHVELRRAQYIHLSNVEFALKTAKIFVQGKLNNMLHFLLLRARQYTIEELRIASIKLKAVASSIGNAKDVETLRGIEGAGTRIYFESFKHFLRNSAFTFEGRNRRPPLDPVNALLSFVYTMLTNETLSAIKISGLDPYLGALHEISYGRPSLACDLVEEYRCFLGDRLVLGLINRKVIDPGDFIYRKNAPSNFADEEEMKEKRPVQMKPATNRALIQAYEEMMKKDIAYPPLNKKITYRWLMLQQVRSFAAYIKDNNNGYSPFTWNV